MRVLAKICFWLAILLFLSNGLGSLGAAHEELRLVGLDPNKDGFATLLNQYRSARALEVGFALFAIFLRKEILTNKKHNAAFLLVLFLMPLSRTISMLIDGWPHYSLMLIMLVEYALFALFLAHARSFIWGADAASDGDGKKGDDPKQLGADKAELDALLADDPELAELMKKP